MSDLVVRPSRDLSGNYCIPAMSPAAIANVRRLTDACLKYEQLKFVTRHLIHGRIYTRTVTVPKRTLVTGVLVNPATTLILSGTATVYIGQAEPLLVRGHHTVLPAAPGRKQAFLTFSKFTMSMMFASDAKTVAEAEAQFTDELELLVPLSERDRHVTIITGE